MSPDGRSAVQLALSALEMSYRTGSSLRLSLSTRDLEKPRFERCLQRLQPVEVNAVDHQHASDLCDQVSLCSRWQRDAEPCRPGGDLHAEVGRAEDRTGPLVV